MKRETIVRNFHSAALGLDYDLPHTHVGTDEHLVPENRQELPHSEIPLGGLGAGISLLTSTSMSSYRCVQIETPP